jgi:T5SS/PEP-CTERM-associated repeat protein
MAVSGAMLVNGTLTSWSTLLGAGVTADDSLIVENAGEAQTEAGIDIGDAAGYSGDVQVTGDLSQLINTGEFIVGDAAEGSLEIEAGGTGSTAPSSGTIGAIIANTSSASGSSVNVTGAGSNWQVNGALVVGGAGFGQLDIAQSGAVTAASLDVGQSASGSGEINVVGTGASLNIAGALTLGDAGTGGLSITDGAVVTIGSLLFGNAGLGAGYVVIGAGSTLAITSTVVGIGSGSGVIDVEGGTLSFANNTNVDPSIHIVADGGLIDPASTLSVSGDQFNGGTTLEASVQVTDTSVATVSQGVVTALSPLITSGDTVNLSGVWSLTNAGTLVLNDNTVDITQTFSFGDGSHDVLVIGHQVTLDSSQNPVPFSADLINNFDGTIQSFFAGDTIVVDTTLVASFLLSGSVISVVDNIGGATEGTLVFHSAAQASEWKNSAGALVDVCFAAGTGISTPNGEVLVEHLAVGDSVLTLRGETRPIVWIGTGKVMVPRGRRSAATPVIVRKGALCDNVPNRDLHVTKGHSLYLDDVLIPVEFLVNHRSILWDDWAREITIYHIELSTHDVLIANGAPAESYRDDGNRWLFQNANAGWFLPPQPACAPVLTGGAVVDAAWRRLLDRSGPRPGLPLTNDADLHLLVDGRRLDAIERRDDTYVFRLPAKPYAVRILSNAAVPQELGVARDARSLGVALQRIVLAQSRLQCAIEANDASLGDGYYPFEVENGIRWTTGDAAIPQRLFARMNGGGMLMLHLGGVTQYIDEGNAIRGQVTCDAVMDR